MTSAYSEFIDFIVSGHSPAEIIAFALSAAAIKCVGVLLAMVQASSLSLDEAEVLNGYMHIEHFMQLAKVRVHQLLADASDSVRPVKVDALNETRRALGQALPFVKRLKNALPGLPLQDVALLQIIHESSYQCLIVVVSAVFERLDEAERQALVWKHLLETFTLDEMARIEFIFTDAPSERQVAT